MNNIKVKNMNKSVSTLMLLLHYMSKSNIALRLSDISNGINTPQATTLRYINTLINEGYAYQDKTTQRYGLTWKICAFSDYIQSYSNISTLSRDIITDLTNKLSFGIALVIERNMESIYLDCIYKHDEMGSNLVRIGKQTPLHSSGSGKLFLSEYSETKLNYFINEKKLTKLTERTITTKEELLIELNKIRNNGYAIDDEECEINFRCASVPIFNYQDRIIAAISSFGSVSNFTNEVINNEVFPILKEAAYEISFRLGGKARKK